MAWPAGDRIPRSPQAGEVISPNDFVSTAQPGATLLAFIDRYNQTARYRAPDEKTIRVALDRLDPRALTRALLGPRPRRRRRPGGHADPRLSARISYVPLRATAVVCPRVRFSRARLWLRDGLAWYLADPVADPQKRAREAVIRPPGSAPESFAPDRDVHVWTGHVRPRYGVRERIDSIEDAAVIDWAGSLLSPWAEPQ